MRMLMGLAIVLTACGGDESSDSTMRARCEAIAEQWCCGFDRDSSDYEHCYYSAWGEACQLLGSAPQTGCGDGACIRSTVDFDACEAAIDALVDVCTSACIDPDHTTECTPLPAECVSAPCTTAADRCPQEPS